MARGNSSGHNLFSCLLRFLPSPAGLSVAGGSCHARRALLHVEGISVSGGLLRLGRVVLCVEGDSGASFAWLCVYTRLFHPPEPRSPSSSRQFRFWIPRIFLALVVLSVWGGCFCVRRALMSRIFPSNGILPKIFTLQRQNCPPTFISRPYSSLLFLAWEGLSVSGGCFYAWRVVLAHILPVYVSTPDIFTLQGLRTYRKISPSR